MKYILIFIALLIVNIQYSHAGLVMDQERYESESSIKQLGKVYLQDNKFKFYDKTQDIATVFDLEKGQLMYINYNEKTYTVTSPEELLQYFKKVSDKIDKQIEADLAKLPADQRKKVENELKKKGFLSNDSKSIKISIKETDNIEKISGYSCKTFENLQK